MTRESPTIPGKRIIWPKISVLKLRNPALRTIVRVFTYAFYAMKQITTNRLKKKYPISVCDLTASIDYTCV